MTVLRRRFKICHSSNKLVGLSHKTDISIFLADKFEYIGILYGKIRSMATQVYRQHIWCQLPCITRTRILLSKIFKLEDVKNLSFIHESY